MTKSLVERVHTVAQIPSLGRNVSDLSRASIAMQHPMMSTGSTLVDRRTSVPLNAMADEVQTQGSRVTYTVPRALGSLAKTRFFQDPDFPYYHVDCPAYPQKGEEAALDADSVAESDLTQVERLERSTSGPGRPVRRAERNPAEIYENFNEKQTLVCDEFCSLDPIPEDSFLAPHFEHYDLGLDPDMFDMELLLDEEYFSEEKFPNLPDSVAIMISMMSQCKTIEELDAYKDSLLSAIRLGHAKKGTFLDGPCVINNYNTFRNCLVFDYPKPRCVSRAKRKYSYTREYKKKKPVKVSMPKEGPSRSTKRDVEKLKMNNFWKVPKGRFQLPVEKPNVDSWTPAYGKTWIRSLASPLFRELHKYPKNFTVMGNTAAHFLYFCNPVSANVISKTYLARKLQNASIWIGNMNDPFVKVPHPHLLSDHFYANPQFDFSSLPIVFADETMTLENYEAISERYLSKHKPVSRALWKFLNKEPVDIPLLRSSLKKIWRELEIENQKIIDQYINPFMKVSNRIKEPQDNFDFLHFGIYHTYKYGAIDCSDNEHEVVYSDYLSSTTPAERNLDLSLRLRTKERTHIIRFLLRKEFLEDVYGPKELSDEESLEFYEQYLQRCGVEKVRTAYYEFLFNKTIETDDKVALTYSQPFREDKYGPPYLSIEESNEFYRQYQLGQDPVARLARGVDAMDQAIRNFPETITRVLFQSGKNYSDYISSMAVTPKDVMTWLDIVTRLANSVSLPREELSTLSNFCAMLISLYYTTSYKGAMATLYLYVQAEKSNIIRVLLLAIFDELKVASTTFFQNKEEASSSQTSSFLDSEIDSDTPEMTIFSNVISQISAVVLSSTFLPLEKVGEFVKEVKTWNIVPMIKSECMKRGAKTIADYLITAFYSLVRVISACITQRSFVPLYRNRDPVRWKQYAVAVRTYYSEIINVEGQSHDRERFLELRNNGLIPTEWLEPFSTVEFNSLINDLVVEGNELQQIFKDDRILFQDIRFELASLNAYQSSNSVGYGVMASRIQPYGIYITGPAGAGKTGLSNQIFKSIGRKFNYPTNPNCRYAWQMNNNFQDGLGINHWFIQFDDIDHNPAAPQAGVDNQVTTIIKVINNEACPVEQSAVELKGKVSTKPLVAVQTSNFSPPRIESYSLHPPAYYRRMKLYIKVNVKPVFQGQDGGISQDLASAQLDGEIYDLEVFEYSLTGTTAGFPYRKIDGVTTKSALLRLILTRFEKHLNEQKQYLMKPLNVDYCQFCFCDFVSGSKACSCEEIDEQPLIHRQNSFKPNSLLSLVGISVISMVFGRYFILPSAYYLVNLKAKVDSLLFSLKETVDLVTSYSSKALLTKEYFEQRVKNFFSYFPRKEIVFGIASISGLLYYYLTKVKIKQQLVENNATEGFLNSGWVRLPQEFIPGLPEITPSTFTYDEAVAQIRKNIVTVHVNGYTVHGFAVSSNLVLTVRHICDQSLSPIPLNSEDVEITIKQPGPMVHKVYYNSFNCTQVSNDAMLIKVQLAGLTGCMSKFWVDRDVSVSQFDKLVMIRKETEVTSTKSSVQNMGNSFVVEATMDTEDGDCGFPYLALMNKSWRIVGIHFARLQTSTGKNVASAQIVSKSVLMAGSARLASLGQELTIAKLQTGLDHERQVFSHFPEKSEIHVCMSNYDTECFPIGYATLNIHGSTMKSNVRPTIFAQYFKHLELKYCGEKDYWVSPSFKGEMRDGKWLSPYTHSFTGLYKGSLKNDVLWLALAQCLKHLYDLQCDGYGEISLKEAVMGIPGSVIQSVDMNTSVGPPFNQKKKGFIKIYEGEVYADPKLMNTTEEIQRLLSDGIIPPPIAICMLKDEQISREKNARLRARVFNCLPFAFNWIMKSKMAGLEAFLRANKLIFGSMVGINMTSLESNEVIHLMKRTNPDEDRFLDLDIEMMDKREKGEFIDFASLQAYAINNAISGKKLAIDGYTLIQALRNTVFVVKNDLFMLGASNPSGNDKTVTINDFINSQLHHYFYYRMKYPNGLPEDLVLLVLDFQRNFLESGGRVSEELSSFLDYDSFCSKVTYGDDSVSSVSPDCSFYDPKLIPSLARECGFKFTDGAKSKDIEWKTLEEITFLKRKFLYREKLKRYVPALSLKTIVKMLVLSKKSSLTMIDHGCTLISDAVRELAYHPREIFDEFLTPIKQCINDLELSDNIYLRIKSYEEYEQDMLDGNFKAWGDENLHPKQVDLDEITILYQMNNDTGIDLKPVIDLAQPVEAINDEQNALGSLHSGADTVNVGTTAVLSRGKIPTQPLGNFMERMTILNQGTFNVTDVSLSQVGTDFDPMLPILSNSIIADKISGYAYIRTSLKVTITVNAPAGSCGLYYLVAIPNGYSDSVSTKYNLGVSPMAVEQLLHIPIDLASCTDGSMVLPWIHHMDYASTTNSGHTAAGQWTLRLYCYSHIRTGVGAVVPIAHFKIFTQCGPDCELVAPHYQMKASTGTGYLAKGLETASAFAPSLKPLATLTNLATSTLDLFGFTRETEQKTPNTVVHRPYSNVANMDGDDTSEIAALSRTNGISIDPGINGITDFDEGSCEYLYSKWTCVSKFSWQAGQAAGTVLGYVPVTPFLSLEPEMSDNGALYTTAGFVGYPFHYWRGDMEYKIVIPISKFHRGVIQVCWSPDSNAGGYSTNQVFNHMLDIGDTACWQFDVGYAVAKPMLTTIGYEQSASFPPLDSCNGVLSFRVVNPLTAQVETATVDIIVFARGKNNMKFGVPKTLTVPVNYGNVRETPTDFVTAIHFQKGAIGNEECDSGEFTLVPESNADYMDVCIGEDFKSVRALMQKFSQDLNAGRYMSPAAGDYGGVWLVPHALPPPIANQGELTSPNMSFGTTPSQNFSWGGYYAAMFVGVAASTRYKFSSTTGGRTQPIGVSHFPIAKGLDLGPIRRFSINSVNPMMVVDNLLGAEVTVPYYFNYKYLKTYMGYSVTTLAEGEAHGRLDTIEMPANNENAVSRTVVMYRAFGPDLRLSMFRVTPRIKIDVVNRSFHWNGSGDGT